MKEEYLLTGPLEPTNEWYAIAKIAGIKLCQALSEAIRLRLHLAHADQPLRPRRQFRPAGTHVLPALIRKFHDAREAERPWVEIWGTGLPRREFLHVDDLADAAVFLMQQYDESEIVNVGVGEDVSIRALAELVGQITGFNGELRFDTSKPDGTPRKLLDVGRLSSLGWTARIGLQEGVKSTYQWFLENRDRLRE
jgi:GDP-L-fucose synthase